METQTLLEFLQWCTIINGGFLILWSTFNVLAPDLVYRTQSRWYPIPREKFDVIMYCYLGLFKVLFLVFNAVPYVALRIAA